MNKKQTTKNLHFLSKEEIAVVSSSETLQQKIQNAIGADYQQEKKIAYIKKLIAAKIERTNKKSYNIKDLTKLITLPQRIKTSLKKISKKNYELFIKLHKRITNIAIDPTKDDITKISRINSLLRSLSTKRKSGTTYNTYNYQQMLALISENAGICRKELQTKMAIQEKAVMRNIKKLQQENLIIQSKQGRKFVYKLSRKGQLQANELTLSFLNRDNNIDYNNTHFKNDSVPKKEILCSEIIAKTKKIDKQLRDLGIYAPRVREFLGKYSLQHIEDLYKSVMPQKRIKNKGAYIYKSLSGCPKSQRIKGFINIHLRGLVSKDVCNMFVGETKDLDINLCLWLGRSLKRLAQKTAVLPCQVHTALHCIYKQMAGTTNESHSYTAINKRSYIARNKKHEEILANSHAELLPQAVG